MPGRLAAHAWAALDQSGPSLYYKVQRYGNPGGRPHGVVHHKHKRVREGERGRERGRR